MNWKVFVSSIALFLVFSLPLIKIYNHREPLRPPAEEKGEGEPSVIVVATLNGEEITLDRFEEEWGIFLTNANVQGPVPSDLMKELKRGLLRRMIDRRILLQEAEKRGIAVSDEELVEEMGALGVDFSSKREDGAEEGEAVDPEGWKARLRENMIIGRLLDAVVKENVRVTEEEIEEYYDKYAENFYKPERIRVSQILLHDKEEAKKLREELLKGMAFEDAARSLSLSPDGAAGGDMGYFSRGELPKEMERVLFRMRTNRLSNVVKTAYGYHLFKVTERLKARRLSVDEAREQITKELLEERREKFLEGWVADLIDGADVKILGENL